MALISEKFNFLFILNPRTASTAIADLLQNQFDAIFIPKKNIINSKGIIEVQSKHSTINELLKSNLLAIDYVNNIFKFVTVRNTFDSIVSLWAKKKYDYVPLLNNPNSFVNRLNGYRDDMIFIRDHTFSEWIQERFSNKKNINTQLKFTEYVDKIIRYENLNEDFSEVLNIISGSTINESDIIIPKINVTQGRKHKNYRSYYNNDSRKIIEDAFSEELKVLGYSF